LFAGSGCAALIYEVVWFQLLQLVIGSSAISIGVLLGTYMGGMCLGSIALSKIVSKRRHPLRIYAAIELGIGICAIGVLLGVPAIDHLYVAVAAQGYTGIAMRAVVSALCLLPPTVLMGASLPAIARWVEAVPEGVAWLGYFYGGNLAGAVFGSLFAGFYLLRLHDMAVATYVAAAINLAVALVSFLLSGASQPDGAGSSELAEEAAGSAGSRRVLWPIYTTIALSGLTALGAEVIWTRLLSLLLGGTVYTFSIILAVFLVGLGIGSAFGSRETRSARDPRMALAVCQLLLLPAIAYAAYTILDSLPYWNPLASTNPWVSFAFDLGRCLWAILPATLLWGASFPLAIAAVSPVRGRNRDLGQLVGEVYAANTIGAIAGALAFSTVLIPWVGTQTSQRLLIAGSLLAGLIGLAPMLRPLGRGLAVGAACSIIALGLGWSVPQIPWLMIGYGHHMTTQTDNGHLLYFAEGMNSSMAVSELPGGQHYFHVSGKVEASTEPFDMRLQRMLGHLPALIHPQPRSVLIVGFGAGVTAGSFVPYPEIQKITICEIEKEIPPATSRYFNRENNDVLHDPRTRIFFDDARHFVLTSQDKYDIITSDPIHPWVKGTSTLYSKEYFEMCKRHLNPGGIVTQWVPLYESDLATVKSELATFFEVFPHGTVWGNEVDGQGYDIVLLGQAGETKIDVDAMEQRLHRPDQAKVAESLREVSFFSASDLLSTYGGSGADLIPWYRGAEINRDLNLRLQYLAGMAANAQNAPAIYSEILRYRVFPKDIITGSEESLRTLRDAIGSK